MDTHQEEDFLLQRFPPDIWAYFVWYLPGEQLGRLMMTGAKVVCQRLKCPNVVKSIRLGKDFMTFTSVPAFLNDFPTLEELLIDSCGDDWSYSLGLSFDSIPSGVRRLELKGDWSNSVTKLFGEGGDTSNIFKHLPHMEILRISQLNIPDYSWMIHSPPSLTDLAIYHWDGTVELPPSLIRFKALNVALSATSFVSKLPPLLESFVVRHESSGVELVIPLLTSSSRKLSLGSQVHRHQNFLDQLPKSLTWLEVPRFGSEVYFAESTALLPSTLTNLNFRSEFPCSAWPLLPKNLKELVFRPLDNLNTVTSKVIDEHGVHHEVPVIPFDTLPRSLTSLNVLPYDDHFCGPPPMSNGSFFPPHLTRLDISAIQLSPEAAKLLPSSLTYLEIANFCERVCEHLPKGLKTLLAFRVLMSPNLIKFLPRSLTFLRLSNNHSREAWFDHKTGKMLDSVVQLPEYALHKNCLSNSFDWKDSPPLPPTLMYFNPTDIKELGDSFLLRQQLPNLIELQLGHSKEFSDLCLPLSSPNLTALNLASSSKISGKSFQFLPRCLIFLNLNSSESIFDSDVQHLPRTMKQAHLCHAIHLTELCIPDLPPLLEKLAMRHNSHITPSSIPHLPYPLRSSQLERSVQFSAWYMHLGVMHHK